MPIKLNEKDIEVFKIIQHLMLECDSVDHKKENKSNTENNYQEENNESNQNNNIINESPNFDLNVSFSDFISSISKRGPDFFNITSIKEDNTLIDVKGKIEKMNYKEVFDYLNTSKEKVLLNSKINITNNNSDIVLNYYDNNTKNIMQFNGEIYDIKYKEILPKSVSNQDKNSENDIIYNGNLLFEILNNFSILNNKSNIEKYVENYFNIYNNIESDHSLYFYDNINNKILITRDILGSRSIILFYIKSQSILIITPVLSETMINMHQNNKDDVYVLELPSNYLFVIDQKNLNQNIFLYNNISMPDVHLVRFNNNSDKITNYDNLTSNIDELLKNSIKKRLKNLNLTENKNTTIGINFSGGLDSSIMTYYILLETPDYINIDLFNLSFDKSSPDRITGIISYKELINKFPNRNFNLILIDRDFNKDITSDFQKHILKLIYPRKTHMDFNISTAKNISTIKKGYLVSKEKVITYFKENENKIINENLISKVEEKTYQNNILTKKIPNFDIEKFADFSKIYESNAIIFFDGLGADEIFGGYLRYKNGDIINQMSKDLDRLWLRNCGRDDRVCGENKIELRFPYLDKDLMNYLSKIEDMKQIVDFSKPRGVGEKYLLRKVAKDILKFNLSHQFEKRAIQFGTKIAHHTNVNKYGSNNKANGKAQFE